MESRYTISTQGRNNFKYVPGIVLTTLLAGAVALGSTACARHYTTNNYALINYNTPEKAQGANSSGGAPAKAPEKKEEATKSEGTPTSTKPTPTVVKNVTTPDDGVESIPSFAKRSTHDYSAKDANIANLLKETGGVFGVVTLPLSAYPTLIVKEDMDSKTGKRTYNTRHIVRLDNDGKLILAPTTYPMTEKDLFNATLKYGSADSFKSESSTPVVYLARALEKAIEEQTSIPVMNSVEFIINSKELSTFNTADDVENLGAVGRGWGALMYGADSKLSEIPSGSTSCWASVATSWAGFLMVPGTQTWASAVTNHTGKRLNEEVLALEKRLNSDLGQEIKKQTPEKMNPADVFKTSVLGMYYGLVPANELVKQREAREKEEAKKNPQVPQTRGRKD